MLLSNYVEGHIFQSILNTTPPRKKEENDKIYWSHSLSISAPNKFGRNEKLHLEDDLEVARARMNQNIYMVISS
ncbi:hypothetical protein AHAS_Ahas01G0050000 [Arachis hypogaea]